MAAETGHAPGRSYVDQNGAPHLNGASFYDANERDIAAMLAQQNLVSTMTASGTITQKTGTIFVTDASPAALTLPTPVAGAQSAGGDDGKSLSIISTTAAQHVVSAAASNGLDGNKTNATFAAAISSSVDLKAFNGNWMIWNSNGSLTLS